MKKAFTTAHLLAALFGINIFFIILVFLQQEAKATSQPPNVPKNFLVVSKEPLHDCCNPTIYIVKDSQTEQEYILVQDSRGISITPRLYPKKEE